MSEEDHSWIFRQPLPATPERKPIMHPALRSFLTTFLAVFVAAIPIAAAVDGDFTWFGAALSAAFVAAVRTGLAALDPGMTLYGNKGK